MENITQLLPGLLAVNVPNESKWHTIIKAHSYMKDDTRLEHSLGGIYLPKGFKYTLIGEAWKVDEQTAKELVEKYTMGGFLPDDSDVEISYKNYYCNPNDGSHCPLVSTALESFQSLLRSKQCFSENPYGKVEPQTYTCRPAGMDQITYDCLLRNHMAWKESQPRVGTWIIIKQEPK